MTVKYDFTFLIFYQVRLYGAIHSNENCVSSHLTASKTHAKRRDIFKWAKSGKPSLGRQDPGVADQLKPQWISP